MGDFLAGFVGPVALMWIVFGYFQQNHAIEIQARELKAAVDQHQAQVTATSALVDHELRRARIDYYRLVSEASRKIQHCKLLLLGDIESEEKKSLSSSTHRSHLGLAMAEMRRQLHASLNLSGIYARTIETKEILEKALDETSEKQAEFEKEIEYYSNIDFNTLERRFVQIVVHIGKAEAISSRIERYIKVELAVEAEQGGNKGKEKSGRSDSPS